MLSNDEIDELEAGRATPEQYIRAAAEIRGLQEQVRQLAKENAELRANKPAGPTVKNAWNRIGFAKVRLRD